MSTGGVVLSVTSHSLFHHITTSVSSKRYLLQTAAKKLLFLKWSYNHLSWRPVASPVGAARPCIPDAAAHIYSALLSSCYLEPPGQNRTSPHWVTEGWLWEGQRALPAPWPLYYGSLRLLTQRRELNNWTSVLVTLYFSLWSYNPPYVRFPQVILKPANPKVSICHIAHFFTVWPTFISAFLNCFNSVFKPKCFKHSPSSSCTDWHL